MMNGTRRSQTAIETPTRPSLRRTLGWAAAAMSAALVSQGAWADATPVPSVRPRSDQPLAPVRVAPAINPALILAGPREQQPSCVTFKANFYSTDCAHRLESGMMRLVTMDAASAFTFSATIPAPGTSLPASARRLKSAPSCVARDSNVAMSCFAVGEDDALWEYTRDGTGRFLPWQRIGGTLANERPTCLRGMGRADGDVHCYARGTDKRLYVIANVGGAWSGWFPVGNSVLAQPADCFRIVDPDPTTHVCFGLDGNAQLIGTHRSGTFPGTWSPWTGFGGVLTTDPSCAVTVGGYINCMGRGQDNQLWFTRLAIHRLPTGASRLVAAQGWSRVPGANMIVGSSPTCIESMHSRLFCAALTQQYTFRFLRFDPASTVAAAWAPPPGAGNIVVTGPPTCLRTTALPVTSRPPVHCYGVMKQGPGVFRFEIPDP